MLEFIFLFLLSIGNVQAEEESSLTILVEAHRNFELYVAPAVVVNTTDYIEDTFNDYSPFGHAAIHSRNAKVPNGHGGHEPITLNNTGFKVYNKDTIKYA